MRPRALLSAFILVPVVCAAEPDIPLHVIRPRLLSRSPAVFDLEVPPDLRARWVRLRHARGRVSVNGVAVPFRAGDRVTSTVALSPYLRVGAANRIEADDFSLDGPQVEFLPRVFLAGAAVSQGRLRILIENTLENAANVVIDVPGAGARGAYVPPETQIEVEFPQVPDRDLAIRLTKFAEALEEGYTTGAPLSSLARTDLQEKQNGAMVFGRRPDWSRFHILERPLAAARPISGWKVR